MTTLREKAEAAALATWREVNKEFSHHGPLAGDREDIGLIADAIERVAREFAISCLLVHHHGTTVAEAIAAAERE